MQVMWIGHGGLLLVSGKTKVVIDPYLSNALRDTDASFKRKMKIKKKILKIKPDAIILTSSHPDRYDPKTVNAYVKQRRFLFFPIKLKNKIDILCAASVFKRHSRSWPRVNANPVMFENGLEWSVGNLIIRGVPAKTDDKSAFGLIVTDITDGKKYYIASNTLYSDEIFEKLPDDIFAAFIPVGGMFGSMNIIDATRFARRLNAQFSIPVLFGMFDKKQKAYDFVVPGRIIPKIYKIIQFTLFPVNSVFSSGLDMFFNEKKKKKIALDDFDDIDKITSDIPVPEEPQEVPAVAEVNDEPVIEEAPIDNDKAPADEEAPVVFEPVIEEAPIVFEPVIEEAPIVFEPVIEEAPVVFEPVIEEAPVVFEPVDNDTPVGDDEEPVDNDTPVGDDEDPIDNDNPEGEGEEPIDNDTPVGDGEEPIDNDTPEGEGEEPVDNENPEGEGEEPVDNDNPEGEGEEPVENDIPTDNGEPKTTTDDE